jgi:hypothetical protein
MTYSRFMRCHTLGPRLGEFPGLMRRRVSRSFLRAGCTHGTFWSLAPLWCCQATQRVFSGFSCFVGQRSCQIFGIRESSEVCDPLGRFLLWLKSSSSSGTRQPPIRHVRGDSARCSIRIAQEERARPIYQRALKAQGRARARAAPKSRDLKFF